MEKTTYKGDQSIENELNKSKKRILGMLGNASLKEISDVVFKEATGLTCSKHCYVAYVDPENRDSVGISFSHLTEGCQYYDDLGEARFKLLPDGSYGGLLGYSLDTGKSFFTHNPKNHPAAHGLPPGHEPVEQFLSVAVKHEGDILGQIVLANPEGKYGLKDLEIAEEIANTYGLVLKELLYGEK